MGFAEEFFISPILEKTGYNPVNTLVYAGIALLAVYALFHILKKFRVKIDNGFFWGVLSFVLFGSTARVVTDAVDAGTFTGVTFLHQWILDAGIYDYGFLTVTPGIYIVVAGLLLGTMAVLHVLKRMELLPYVGLALFAFHFFLLIPFMQYWEYAVPVLLMAGIPAYLVWKRYGAVASAVVGGHALDGAATFIILDVFSSAVGKNYFEQHVLSRAVGELLDTYFLFYLVKVAIASAAVYLVEKEKMPGDERIYFYLVVAIIGLAPGIRSVLRMVCGT
ncbi:DUF63 family protein [Candidatus Micrarchaeota archaeon]|nr:DUF63 family protein [Candidatus Micrarchaeota archaeon]MBD3417988.1 DUF63 family protein [Candidatus Micrarchaeota archaeon]